MIKRTLYFSSPCRLSLKNRQLVIENHETGEKTTAPIEDIGIVLIENQSVSISIPAMNALTENNCAVVLCDSRHMPASMLLPLEGNSVQQESYRFQIEATTPLKKNLWKQIIEAKIRNQANLLNVAGKDGNILKPLYSNVKSGDEDNKEGVAARLYWCRLFGDGFKRDNDFDIPNPFLNYGYAILRAGMARALVGSGLHPSFGLFHRNRYNAFPLADDMMEPYRPFVDKIVLQILRDGHTGLNVDTKQQLLRVMFMDTSFKTMTRPLEIALSISSASLVKCLRGEQKILSFPILQ